MLGNGRLRLRQALALGETYLLAFPATAALGGDDPFHLQLPPLVNAGGSAPTPAAVRGLAALYLQAELEQAGVIPAAELLAQERSQLAVMSQRAATRLEEFARRARDWYDRDSRDLLFARLFGLGRAAADTRGDINRDFQQRFAALCQALIRYQEDYAWGQAPAPRREAALRQTAVHLLMNLGSRQSGNALVAGPRIQQQLREAIALLNDSDIGALFQTRGMWDTLRKIFGPEAPDLGRLVDRGQNGMQLLHWLAGTIGQLEATPPFSPLASRDAPVFLWSAAWLRASGIEG